MRFSVTSKAVGADRGLCQGKVVDLKEDKALQLLAGLDNADFDVNSPEARRVLRKIDRRIMPMVFAIYLLQLMVCYLSG